MRRAVRILILQLVIAGLIAAGGPIGLAAAQGSTPTVYVVQAGDTLSSIARRYGLNVNDLAALNGLINPNLIYVGQSIKLSGAAATSPTATPNTTPNAPTASQLYVVQSGDTLFRIALRFGTSVQNLVTANQLNNAAFIYVGQQLIIPSDATSAQASITQPSTPLPAPFTSLEIGPLPLEQGSLMVVTVRTDRPVTLNGSFTNWTIPFAQDGDKYIGLVGVGAHPVSGVAPGIYPVSVTATDADGQQVTVTTNVQINAGHFNYEYINLSADRQNLLDPAIQLNESNRLNAIWTIFNPVRYWNGLFRVPVANYTRISSPFGTRRSYDGGPFTSYHEGTDFAIPSGTPVYAPADGVVVLAEQLNVRGNAVVIDHGWGVFSGLYHLQSFAVTVGQHVKQGDLVAYSDNTGLSTGAHLHWDIRIRGLNVDAMQLTQHVFP
jgi:murein DD-endopeptidase MepM/ murein hydrolase activator NlpD